MDNLKRPIFLNPKPNTPANRSLIEKLRDIDVSMINWPTITLEKTTNDIDKSALENTSLFIFTSQAAVSFAFDNFSHFRIKPWQKVAAIGPMTKKQLIDKGIDNIICPKKANSESLFETLNDLNFSLKDQQVLLVTGENGRQYLQENLKKLGAIVNLFHPYQRKAIKKPNHDFDYALSNLPIDYVLASSVDVCQALIDNCDILQKKQITAATWIAMSDRIKSHLLQQGFEKILVTDEDLFSTIKRLNQSY